MKGRCYFQGKTGLISDFHLPINDLSVLRGYGIFDYLRTYNGKPFLLDEHIERFFNSASLLGLAIKENRTQIKGAIYQLLSESGLNEAGFRLVLTGGASPDAFSYTSPNFFILIEALPEYDNAIWVNGVKLMLHNYLRCMPEVKSINYAEAIRLQPERIKQKAFDILYSNENKILECTRSNFFLFHGDVLVTPSSNVLLGRTRNLIIELAKIHFSVEERDIDMHELSQATEAFVSGTTKKVMPVVEVSEQVIADGKRGVNTLKLQAVFDEYIIKNYS